MKKETFKGTQGSFKADMVMEEVNSNHYELLVHNSSGNSPALAYGNTSNEAFANATLIAEAFNVVNTTGLTPNQLAEQNKELLVACKRLQCRLELLINSTPTSEYRNALTEENILALTAIKNAEQ